MTAQNKYDIARNNYLARVTETGGLSEAADPVREALGKILTDAAYTLATEAASNK